MATVVCIESPYSFEGSAKMNVEYARDCAMHSMRDMGEAPITLHGLLLTLPRRSLYSPDVAVIYDRRHALECRASARRVCDMVVFYTDRGWSPGMLAALEECKASNKPYEERRLWGRRHNEILEGQRRAAMYKECFDLSRPEGARASGAVDAVHAAVV
jgi:hypothetical protein